MSKPMSKPLPPPPPMPRPEIFEKQLQVLKRLGASERTIDIAEAAKRAAAKR